MEACPSPYAVDREDYSAELSNSLASAWKAARETIQESQRRQKQQYDKRVDRRPYLVSARVHGLHAERGQGQEAEAGPSLHGPYRIVEVRSNTLLVRPVDVPAATPILVSKDRVTRCAPELPDKSWLGPRRKHQKKRKDRSAMETRETETAHKYPLRSRNKK